ncbi:N-acetylmuramoyl-L-alanine amidase family protein [Lysinibacillus mangiferihumi]|uniref:N-acetylmuramoyl-L-alanine amidase n=1 Tax=Lysinibacillus mangiferihumi TaxID=1130819 RepID=A0A4U2YWW0_9BACI|nr:N-acetylmuramoyl-L-alanine amidase family protein [Lysinibacillus mangiferihumi]TKI65545.1 N-acetylmuramoyl-L-alanine amidase family protein [Lysinibacillus mangiferihumi]
MAYVFKQNLLPASKYPIKAPYSMTPQYITVHNTANDASAGNEIKYMITNNNQVSYHVAIDDKEVIQAIRFNRNAWHCGDGQGNGNRKSIGIEICYSKSGGVRYAAAEENAVQYIAKLLKEYGWGIERVKKHQDWNGKYCPHRILSENRWNSFLKRIEEAMNPTNTIQLKEETKVPNTLTSTAKEDLKGLLKATYQKGILKVDHSERVGSMTDGEALGLLISVVKRTL